MMDDFGKWVVPTKWDDVSLGMFQGIQALYDVDESGKSFDVRDVLHILCHKTVDEVNALPLEFLEKIVSVLGFLRDPLPDYEPKPFIEVDGVRYGVNGLDKMKTGEYVAADTALKANKHNFAAVLAVLCRKDGEIYDSHFENEVLEGRIEFFKSLPVTKVMSLVTFFLTSASLSLQVSNLYSQVELGINLMRKSIANFAKNGRSCAFYTKYLMMKLRKLEKSISSI